MSETPDGTFRARVLGYEIDAEVAIERLFNCGATIDHTGFEQLIIARQAINAAVALILQAAAEDA
jgi:hypothetical protein